jgi:hypothetical protein
MAFEWLVRTLEAGDSRARSDRGRGQIEGAVKSRAGAGRWHGHRSGAWTSIRGMDTDQGRGAATKSWTDCV